MLAIFVIVSSAWTEFFASRAEILEYLRGFSQKHILNENIRFSSAVSKIKWVEEEEQWRVTILDKRTSIVSELSFNFV